MIDSNQPTAPSVTATGPFSPALSSLVEAGFGVHLVQTSANSSYNSLQMSLVRRLAANLQFIAAYTYSHSIDDYSGDPSGTDDVSVVPGNQLYLDNRGSSDFDRRHRLIVSGVYDFPKFRGASSGIAGLLLNGWQIAGIITLQSGTPFSVLTNETVFVAARADWNPALPSCKSSLSGTAGANLNEYFNLACFVPAVAPGDFGTTGRNILVGPGQKDIDISMIKFFSLTERSTIEFRAEFLNAFNNVNFANPVNILANANAGAIVAASTGPRVVQLALKFNF
jgi:hypothetical protein